MSRSELDRFLQDLREQPELRRQFQTLLTDTGRSLRWAEEKGYHLTFEQVDELANSERDLSDEELEEVAGGDDGWSSGGSGGGGG